MANVDEAVVNLQRFIGLLVDAKSSTAEVGDHVKEASRRFAELEGEAEEEGGGLNDHLTDLGATLTTGEAEAVAAITELTQSATDAQEAAGDAQEKVEQAATDLESKASTVENGLEEASTQLTNEGFQPMGQAIQDAQQELEAESREEEQAFTELAGALGGFEAEAETAWNEAESELEEATSDLAEGASALEGESAEGVQAFGTAATELEGACTDLEAEIDTIYDVFDQGVEGNGQAWQAAVQAAGQEALTFVTEGQQLRLDQPGALVEDEALATLSQEYDTLGTLLEAALTVVSELEPLAEDLVKCQAVMRDIDELMAALAS